MSASTLAQRRFAEADARAEMLLGYVRMAVALVLAASIILAGTSDERPDDPLLTQRLTFAIIGMGAYFLIGLGAVILVRIGRYAPWIAWATAACDVGLISWNIYSATQMGGLSSAYALTSPAAMMVPLVLTFGALRFQPAVQLFATVFAGGCVAYVVLGDPAPGAMTPGVAAQIATAYGAPPNAVRIVMIVGAGLIVALAVWRARRLLERVIAETEARANLTRFLPAEIAGDMSDDGLSRMRTGRRARLGVVFIDIRGFTRLSAATSPEAAVGLLTDYRARILDVAAAHGGLVDKFIGDGALLVFGVEGDGRDAAAATLAAARDLADAFAEADFAVGVGAHFGDAMIGAVGDDRRLEFTVVGGAVNVASRIEEMTKETGDAALASAELIEAAGDGAGWRSVGAKAIRGFENPMEIFAAG